jgi:hypothetical protein
MIIAEYFVRSIYTGLSPLIWHYGVGGVIVLACLAWAYFMPMFKKTALWVALAVIVGLVMYTAGVNNEISRQKAKEANAGRTIKKAKDAAHNRVITDTTGRLLLGDRYNRDK